jgi:hypothetical protein
VIPNSITQDDVFRGLELAREHGIALADIELVLAFGNDAQRDAIILGLGRIWHCRNDFSAFSGYGGSVVGLIAEVKDGLKASPRGQR